MIFLAGKDGSFKTAIPSSVYQGSNYANEVILIAPYPKGYTVQVCYVLPNGERTNLFYMDPVFKDIEDESIKNMGVWSTYLDEGISNEQGEVEGQFFISLPKQQISTGITEDNKITTKEVYPTVATYKFTFFVTGAGKPTITPNFTDSQINEINRYLGVLANAIYNGNNDMGNNSSAIIELRDSFNIFKQGINRDINTLNENINNYNERLITAEGGVSNLQDQVALNTKSINNLSDKLEKVELTGSMGYNPLDGAYSSNYTGKQIEDSITAITQTYEEDGIAVTNDGLKIVGASNTEIDNKSSNKPITTINADYATKKAITDPSSKWSPEDQAKALNTLGIDASGGTIIEANPEETANKVLNTVKIGTEIYEIPTEGSDLINKVVDLIQTEGAGDKYLADDGKYKLIPSGGLTEEEKQELNTTLANKVDKVEGKGLSTNDYTDKDRSKVDKLIIDGESNKLLSADGTYKTVKLGGATEENAINIAPEGGEIGQVLKKTEDGVEWGNDNEGTKIQANVNYEGTFSALQNLKIGDLYYSVTPTGESQNYAHRITFTYYKDFVVSGTVSFTVVCPIAFQASNDNAYEFFKALLDLGYDNIPATLNRSLYPDKPVFIDFEVIDNKRLLIYLRNTVGGVESEGVYSGELGVNFNAQLNDIMGLVNTDTTLSVDGAPADAKVTGDALEKLRGDIVGGVNIERTEKIDETSNGDYIYRQYFSNGTYNDFISPKGVPPKIRVQLGDKINEVGYPSVDAVTENNITTLTFNNLKGQKGDQGEKGIQGDAGVVLYQHIFQFEISDGEIENYYETINIFTASDTINVWQYLYDIGARIEVRPKYGTGFPSISAGEGFVGVDFYNFYAGYYNLPNSTTLIENGFYYKKIKEVNERVDNTITKVDKVVYKLATLKSSSVVLVSGKDASIQIDTALSLESENPVQNKVIVEALNGKQDKLIAGENITIEGNVISAQGGSGGVSQEYVDTELAKKVNVPSGISTTHGVVAIGYNANSSAPRTFAMGARGEGTTNQASIIAQYNANGKLMSGTPTQDTEVANKKYVDDAVANAGGGGGSKIYLHNFTYEDEDGMQGYGWFYSTISTPILLNDEIAIATEMYDAFTLKSVIGDIHLYDTSFNHKTFHILPEENFRVEIGSIIVSINEVVTEV